ncbi:hypothetical protein [Cytophaga hutchinsonii]|jgi:hypothetical protein|uniref:Uncharacterized protein n=1 Tax=Cytophaga hutchinsonii (strain ATCC 33406 / DSM 1761 / CIP 103989 / NBRC 15051 / NCIMB 9469 / D465) TaxID=269798 RepID=A0A6N4SWI5_CYTH3|nr:hypothetical protein [Cytophaga hutchinsonii]ABG60826.1 hypothetical protein CHU_3593 [Cytophaga hutchinsonii ATCC 33406]SFX72711.1 hypothetical protein SAMN04487930_108151 [Cytophaga hutchinsonii ATCC 33406]
MEPTITADVIYTLVLKLKGDGLNEAEIKKALVNSVMGEQQLLQTLNKEAIFLHKKEKSKFQKRSVLYSVFGSVAIYFILSPFLSEKAANFICLTLALGVSTFLVIKLRTLFA